jgi:Tol biopolymer transport system component
VSWNKNNNSIDDVGFLSTIIDNCINEFELDSDKVYFCGISNGGQMSYRMACEKTNKIAGIAAVVSSMSEDLFSICLPDTTIPVFITSGTDDPLVPYDGGDIVLFNKKYGKALSFNQTVDFWVKHNNCSTEPVISYLADIDPNDGVRVRTEKYENADNETKVLHFIMEGGGHTWSGGPQYFSQSIIGKTCYDYDACESIWNFFQLNDTINDISDNIIKKDGYRVSWSKNLDIILFDKMQSDEFYDIYTMNPDGSNEICLTNNSNFLKGHKGCGDWHPSGDYIVFTSQKDEYFGSNIPVLKNLLSKLAVPGEGINCDLWVMNKEGSKSWPLTNLPTKTRLLDKQPYTGVLHPHFSNDGSKLFWSERIAGGEQWGEWVLRVADFKIKNDTPLIENIVTHQPGNIPCFYESHGFSPDDKKIIFSGNLEENQHVNHLDIYTYDLESLELLKLTDSSSEWDEHAHFTMDGERIIWMSSEGYSMNTERDWWNYLETDYWMMNSDGSEKTRITFYNQVISENYRIICSDCSISPDGSKLATTMLIIKDNNVIDGGIGIITLK